MLMDRRIWPPICYLPVGGDCFCDGCMAEAVDLDRYEARQIRLGESGSFSQDFDCCAGCGRQTVVIRAARSRRAGRIERMIASALTAELVAEIKRVTPAAKQ